MVLAPYGRFAVMYLDIVRRLRVVGCNQRIAFKVLPKVVVKYAGSIESDAEVSGANINFRPFG